MGVGAGGLQTISFEEIANGSLQPRLGVDLRMQCFDMFYVSKLWGGLGSVEVVHVGGEEKGVLFTFCSRGIYLP